ncbi:helix-hairpin-helix domain-containing protein [Candidatus Roizmanbacteria bacterium]|nr:MAG: helix-hairpin-helix domain-containing protein [Candidatus Roizmanbacteria bacterium]
MNYIIPLYNNIISSATSLRRYIIEICLIAIAAVITVVSLVQQREFDFHPSEAAVPTESKRLSPTPIPRQTVSVDVSGAVYNPGVYEASAGARIGDLVEMAGGISHEADRYFVARNFNMARFVGDQDKIYIPFMFDIALGTFTERKRILEYLQPLGEINEMSSEIFPVDPKQTETGLTVSINEASAEELDTLPGVGSVTVQKIIENRPYIVIEDLLNKKVMNQSTYAKIKDNISL